MGSISSKFRRFFEKFLESVVLLLMTTLAVVVVLGVVFRKAGAALVWYDEVASILLAWLTYYAASLAALKRAHIGFPKLVESARPRLRFCLVVVREFIVVGFFVLVAWSGWRIIQVLEGTYLVSLPWVPAQVAQSVIPIGAVLFVIAELVSAVEVLGKSRLNQEKTDGEQASRSEQ
ncbi:MAG: TRAP transporter small permease subunit [Planctomycetota bacterium]|nr:TRAP transporter small permease subunit [Planctomycetota bacterium]